MTASQSVAEQIRSFDPAKSSHKVKLRNVAKFIRGITYKPGQLVDNFEPHSAVCMRTKNVQAKLDDNDLVSVPERLVKRSEQQLQDGDLLVSTANSWNLVGKCCWVPEIDYPATAGGFIAILRGEESAIDRRYLYHWFSSPHTQALARNCGRQTTNISNMDIQRCLDIELPLPPLPEQRRIAAILDKADALRQKRREAIAKLDQLLQSVFLEMFGDPAANPKNWDMVKLDEVVSIDAALVDPRSDAYERLLHYGPDRISSETGLLLPAKTAVEDKLISKKFLCNERHILYSKIRPYLNKVALVEKRCLCSADVYPVEPARESIEKVFLWTLLRSKHFLEHASSFSNRANIPKLNRKQFLAYDFPLPPIDRQRQYAVRFATLKQTADRYSQASAHLENLFGSLQQRAFTGQL